MRKVLSFVLVLALVLGSFSFAFGLTDIEDSANKDAIQVSNDLGIITGYPDGTFQGDKAVNRAEFAAMITRALGVPESALAGYATTSFKDVAGYGWAVPYLAFCESKGIMLGDGMGNAMPGRTISVNEAITMALRAVGYTENSAMLVGTWPSNYVTLGQQQGLYTDLATATTIDRANAAQVIYNAMTIDLVTVNADGKTEVVTGTNKTMMEAYHDVTSAPAIIIGRAYTYDTSVINITDRIGAFGTGYTKDGDLVAFKAEADYMMLTGSLTTDNKFEVGDKTYNLSKTTGAATFFLNSEKQGAPTSPTFDESSTQAAFIITSAAVKTGGLAMGSDDGETVTLFAKVSGNYLTVVKSVVTWEADKGAKVASGVQADIADGVLLGYSFDLDKNDDIVDTSFQLLGVASLGDIKAGNVVAVYDDGDYIRKVTVGTEIVTGTVDEVGGTFFYVDGTKYSLSDVQGAETTKPTVGSEGTFWLDYNGDVYKYDVTGSTDMYGVIADYNGAAGTFEDDIVAKMFTEDGSLTSYYFADDYADVVKNPQLVTVGAVTGTSVVFPALVAYSLDNDGKLDVIDGAAKYSTPEAVSLKTNLVATIGATFYDVSSDVVVFVKDAAVSKGYKVKSVSDVMKGVALTGAGTTLDTVQVFISDDEIVALLIDETALASDTNDDIYGVVNTATLVKVGDDTIVKLEGFFDGVAGVKYTTTNYKNETDRGNIDTWRKGELLVFTPNTSGDITAITKASVAYSTSNLFNAKNVTRDGINADGTRVTADGGEMLSVNATPTVYLFNANTNKFSLSSMGKIGTGDLIKQAFDVDGMIKAADADNYAEILIFEDK